MSTPEPDLTCTCGEVVFSASQVATFLDCRRKWAWKYIGKEATPTHPSAALGSLVHEQLERWMLGGSLDFTCRSGYIAAEISRHLPSPGTPGLRVEGRKQGDKPGKVAFTFKSAQGWTWLGYKDWELPARGYLPPMVGDHKTTSDFKWAKTSDELLTDPQAILYAADTLLRNPDATAVDLQWTYGRTRGSPLSKPVRATMTREAAEKGFDEIERVAAEMASTLRSTKDPLQVAPNYEACEKFGGCPHRTLCKRTPLDTLRSVMSSSAPTTTSSLLEKLRSKKEATATIAPPAPVEDKQVPLPLAATPLAATPLAATPLAAPAPDPMKGGRLIDDLGVVPGVVVVTPEMAEALTKTAVPPPATAARKGRPPGSKNKPKEAEPAKAPSGANTFSEAFINPPEFVPVDDAKPTIPAPPPDSMEAAVMGHTAPPAAKGDYVLCVDCYPEGVSVSADALIAKAKATINATFNVADYRYIEYGQGAGALSAAVADLAKSVNGFLTLCSSTPEGSVCKAALVAGATGIIRGVR